ncbi:hypothetical protein NM688_g589 [Phlebia brevispora]|uniref:Uncharacterized protein n=1 Tax=Phlebia brevispora TaxID=194682 RepID=A0ACC1TEP9_9APHY|nr:hypothetical protein NM688_g589 [Phlebia brevispora]
MPPGPAYNLLCVAHSLCQVLNNVAQIRAAQLARNAGAGASHHVQKGSRVDKEHRAEQLKRTQPVREEEPEHATTRHGQQIPPSGTSSTDEMVGVGVGEDQNSNSTTPSLDAALHSSPDASSAVFLSSQDVRARDMLSTSARQLQEEAPQGELSSIDSTVVTGIPDVKSSPIDVNEKEATSHSIPTESQRATPAPIRKLQSSKVPSSRIGRLFHYGGLAASLGFGAATELLRRTTHTSEDASAHNSLMMSEGNIKRLVAKLTRMRGAALKIGQFLSIQDSHVLPPEVEEIFRRVQDSAHYMPDWQMEQVMKTSLGPDWATKFVSFDRVPFAAASIGQVHSAVLAASVSPTGKDYILIGLNIPIDFNKQRPGLLMTAGRILPRGLFLDRTLQVMKSELADECAYTREASFLRRFREFLGNDARFHVPWVWDGSTDQVLVMERVDGTSVGGSVIEGLSQEDRDVIAERIIDLCLHELFVYRMMQTDPNWTNFLWNSRTHKVELVDFGATREYSKEFIDNWLHLLQAASLDDRQACIDWSREVGYLTGQEDEVMLDAHVKSMCLLATPFKASTKQPFAFGPGSPWADITAEIRAQIPVMLQHRLTPPPRETYSLNSSTSFKMQYGCASHVDCRARGVPLCLVCRAYRTARGMEDGELRGDKEGSILEVGAGVLRSGNVRAVHTSTLQIADPPGWDWPSELFQDVWKESGLRRRWALGSENSDALFLSLSPPAKRQA